MQKASRTPSKRNRQVADLIHREVALMIKNSVNDPRLTKILVTSVDLSSDLSNARVYYTVPEDVSRDVVENALKKATGFIRHELSSRTELRYTPHIKFCYDDSIDRARHLLSLMEDIKIESND